MIKKIINHWKEIKALINADEYLLVIANKDLQRIKYEYINNTDRELFYVFVQDYIKNKLKDK